MTDPQKTKVQVLLDLAERVEKADGPDRELDGDIASALELYPSGWRRGVKSAASESMWFSEWASYRSPDFTASLDAAKSLVPKGWSILFASNGETGICDVHSRPLGEAGEWPAHARAMGDALALTAAALRAKAAALESEK